MQFPFPWERAHVDAGLSRFLAKLRTRRTEPGDSSDRRRFNRARQFASYYRPHRVLLAADLACSLLIAATAIALPLCANYVTTRLVHLAEAPDALGQIYAMGGLMLAVLAVQV